MTTRKPQMIGAQPKVQRQPNGFSKARRTPANFELVREAANGFLRNRGIHQYGSSFERPMPKNT